MLAFCPANSTGRYANFIHWHRGGKMESPRGEKTRTSSDSQTSQEVVNECPDGRLPLKRRPVCGNHAVDGNSNNEGDVEPVDVLVPVVSGQRLVCDVQLFGGRP